MGKRYISFNFGIGYKSNQFNRQPASFINATFSKDLIMCSLLMDIQQLSFFKKTKLLRICSMMHFGLVCLIAGPTP